MPELGVMSEWEGGPERWERSLSHRNDVFGCRFDREGKKALDPRSGKGKGKAMQTEMEIGWGGRKKVFCHWSVWIWWAMLALTWCELALLATCLWVSITTEV